MERAEVGAVLAEEVFAKGHSPMRVFAEGVVTDEVVAEGGLDRLRQRHNA